MSGGNLHTETPLLRTDPAYARCGRPLWLKMDALQPAGSYKLRGIGRVCRRLVDSGARRLVCASGGNAGFATAVAGRALGAAVVIVVPESTGAEVRARIAAVGATVEVHGPDYDVASARARALGDEPGSGHVHPFDDPVLWDGHATLIDEVVASGAAFDCVVVSVGGGGLLAGVVEGLRRNGRADVPVIAVETRGADSLNQSVMAGELVTLPAITSIATTLGARRVSARALDLVREGAATSVLVDDAQAVAACLKFADSHRVLVEPACGAALAVADAHPDLIGRYVAPLIEVCGGIGISLAALAGWRERFGAQRLTCSGSGTSSPGPT